jgi:hypothetical protein
MVGAIEEAVFVYLVFIPPQKNRYWEASEGSVVGLLRRQWMEYTSFAYRQHFYFYKKIGIGRHERALWWALLRRQCGWGTHPLTLLTSKAYVC